MKYRPDQLITAIALVLWALVIVLSGTCFVLFSKVETLEHSLSTLYTMTEHYVSGVFETINAF